jgi:hypothetical protein
MPHSNSLSAIGAATLFKNCSCILGSFFTAATTFCCVAACWGSSELSGQRLDDLAVRSIFAELVFLVLHFALDADLGMRRPSVLTERSLILRDGFLDGRDFLLKQFLLLWSGITLRQGDAPSQCETSERPENLS